MKIQDGEDVDVLQRPSPDRQLKNEMKIEKVTFGRNSSNSQNGESSSCGTIKQQALAIKESSLTYLQDPLLLHFLIFILFCSIAIIFMIGIMFLMYR